MILAIITGWRPLRDAARRSAATRRTGDDAPADLERAFAIAFGSPAMLVGHRGSLSGTPSHVAMALIQSKNGHRSARSSGFRGAMSARARAFFVSKSSEIGVSAKKYSMTARASRARR